MKWTKKVKDGAAWVQQPVCGEAVPELEFSVLPQLRLNSDDARPLQDPGADPLVRASIAGRTLSRYGLIGTLDRCSGEAIGSMV